MHHLRIGYSSFEPFLRVSAPNSSQEPVFSLRGHILVSNNDNERQLKRAVLNRKNAYFFKNETGAKIADILMSVIETCALNKINPYNYLTAIQKNTESALEDPKAWLPWNYSHNLAPP